MKHLTKATRWTLAVLIITAVLWIQALLPLKLSISVVISTILGALAVATYVINFVFAIRHPRFEVWFGGLEKQYVMHKNIGVLATVLVIVHGMTSKIAPMLGETFSVQLGALAQILTILLIVFSLFAKRIKYEHWRFIHRLFIIPFSLGVYHSFFSSPVSLFEFNALSLWMMGLSIFGIGSSIYMLFFYQRFGFSHKGEIVEIKHLSPKHVELKIKMKQAHSYRAGQFVFMKLIQEGLDNSPHPFSLSNVENDTIEITIKALGDFTKQLVAEIKLKTAVSLDGPYGNLDFSGSNKQIWIAGGVGITPFIAQVRNLDSKENVELFYSYRGEDEVIFRDLLLNVQADNGNFKVHFINSRVE